MAAQYHNRKDMSIPVERLQSLCKPTHFSWQALRFGQGSVQGDKAENKEDRGRCSGRVPLLRLLKGRKAYEGCNTHFSFVYRSKHGPVEPRRQSPRVRPKLTHACPSESGDRRPRPRVRQLKAGGGVLVALSTGGKPRCSDGCGAPTRRAPWPSSSSVRSRDTPTKSAPKRVPQSLLTRRRGRPTDRPIL